MLGFHQQVNVVEHQNVGVEPQPVALLIVPDALKVRPSILVVLKVLCRLLPCTITCQRPIKPDSGLAFHR